MEKTNMINELNESVNLSSLFPQRNNTPISQWLSSDTTAYWYRLLEENILSPPLVIGEYQMPTATQVPRPAIERGTNGRFQRPMQPPTLKQIWKYSQMLHDGLVHDICDPDGCRIGSVPSPQLKDALDVSIASLFLKMRQWDRKLTVLSNVQNRQSKKYRTLIDSISRTRPDQLGMTALAIKNNLDRICRDNQYFGNPGVPPSRNGIASVKDIFNDVLELTKMYTCVWDRDAKTIRITSPIPFNVVSPTDLTLRYEFGYMYFYLPTGNYKFFARGLTPRYAVSEGRRTTICHPHIGPLERLRTQLPGEDPGKIPHAGHICFGEGEHSYFKALKEGRVTSCVEIALSVLPHMGGRPYAKLTAWDGVCDVRFDPSTGMALNDIQEIVENAPVVMVNCTGCNVNLPITNAIRCGLEHCTSVGCVGCILSCSDPDCDEFFCIDHSERCSRCRNRYCTNGHIQIFDPETGSICRACWQQLSAVDRALIEMRTYGENEDEDEDSFYDEDNEDEDSEED